jgi:hypothetical protein
VLPLKEPIFIKDITRKEKVFCFILKNPTYRAEFFTKINQGKISPCVAKCGVCLHTLAHPIHIRPAATGLPRTGKKMLCRLEKKAFAWQPMQ